MNCFGRKFISMQQISLEFEGQLEATEFGMHEELTEQLI